MPLNPKNLIVILVIVLANALAFIGGGYYSLTPVIFIAGFTAICAISAWASLSWKTNDLVVLAVAATLLALVDEYAHTSVGTLTYFDKAVPSPLTVFGWSVFMIFLVGANKAILKVNWLQLEDHKNLRTVPVFALLALILASIVLQGYLNVFNTAIILVYLLLFAASFYYTHNHPLKWNLTMIAISLAFGLSMEYLGGMEGLWAFRFQDPVSLLILFSWPLRLFTVCALCSVVGVEFVNSQEKRPFEPQVDADPNKSIIVVADTHFGLRKENEHSDPKAFSDFLSWVASLEQKGPEKLNSRIWSRTQEETITIKPPEKLIFLGDIMELWDASKQTIDVCTRSIIQSLSGLSTEKIYILGNHDTELAQLADEYPLGVSHIHIQEGEYSVLKGGKKLVFLHGHEFDKLFSLPSWRIMPYINKAAMVFDKYTWVFVVFFGLDLSLLFTLGFSSVTDWIILFVLGAVSVPFLVTEFGRKVWNKLKSTKYKPENAEEGLEKWWNKLSRKTDSDDWNIVYGHTHVIGFWSTKLGKEKLTLYNLPSWVKDSNQKGDVSLNMVFRHGFLYIDSESIEFFGWDTEKKRPFLVPKDIIQARLQNGDANRVAYDVKTELEAIGWPPELIEKWLGYSFGDKGLA